MPRGFPRLYLVASTLFRVNQFPSLYNYLFRNFLIAVWYHSSEFSALLPDQSQTNRSWWFFLWKQGLYFGSSGDTSKKYTAFLPFLVPNLPCASPPDVVESSSLETPIWYRKDAYHFSIFLSDNVEQSRFLPEWPCWVVMYIGSSWQTPLWIFWNNCWPVILILLSSNLHFFLASFLPFLPFLSFHSFLSFLSFFLSLLSFFLSLVSFPRIWYDVSPLIMFGLSFLMDPMYSPQDSAPVLSRFPTCLVNQTVFLDKPDCKVSLGIQGSRSRLPLAINVTYCATFSPEPSDVSSHQHMKHVEINQVCNLQSDSTHTRIACSSFIDWCDLSM